jgi:alpha-amylase
MHLLTPQDRTGQIEMLSTYIRKHFGKRSTGAWIPGACWDHSVVTPLSNCAIAYTFLPESHFLDAGVKSADLGRPVYTENQGALIMVFSMLPSGRVSGVAGDSTPLTVESLRTLTEERGRRGVYAFFPDRFSLGGKEDMADICAFLENSVSPGSEINWTIPSRLREEYSKEGKQSFRRLYFPGGEEKKFLTECSEANTIYAKMVFTRDLVRQLRGDRERKNAALHEVYKAQCYNLYSPSARHTIAEPALRQAAYRALLSAEKMVRETKKTVNALYSFDFDFDGGKEDVFRSNDLCCYAHRKGGHIFGIDYLPGCWNYIDSFNNHSFIETLYPPVTGVKSDSGNAVREKLAAIDQSQVRHCGEVWWKEIDSDRAKQKLTFSLPKAHSGTAFDHIGIEKTYRLKKDTLVVNYTAYNRRTAEERFLFCPELHLSFAGQGAGQLRIFAKKGEEQTAVAANDCLLIGIDGVEFQDLINETVVRFSSDKQFDAILGINSLSGRYQSNSILLVIPVVLRGGAKTSREFRFTVTH